MAECACRPRCTRCGPEQGDRRCPRRTRAGARAARGAQTRRRLGDGRRGRAKAKRRGKSAKPADAKPKRLSALDAAAQVLQKSGQAMRSTEMIAAMAEQGLWTSPNGKTPHATLHAAILREIGAKAKDARFRKVERGKFEFNG